jgi:5-methylcytosine-specific restriction endonuclease McrA
MARLTTLKPRLAVLQPQRLPTRQKTAQRGYGSAWQRARLHFLREHPLCVMCERDGRVKAANVVDHIIPHRGDQRLFWDAANWQPLCKPHHASEKQRQELAAERQRP